MPTIDTARLLPLLFVFATLFILQTSDKLLWQLDRGGGGRDTDSRQKYIGSGSPPSVQYSAMDELVRHCLRELSFDGDLGCDASRLRDFVVDFYAQPGPSGVQGQNVDDGFCAFVWSVIVQQPGVRVGTVPSGSSTEVYVAPQASVIKKAKAKGEETGEPAAATALDIIQDATIRSLDDLRNEYGDRLRVAVDPETTFAALTGSHIRPSKLTPMIYTGLQIITRGREQGVSVLDLGKKSGYDQKTCFYIIKQLVELGFVVKLRRPGVSTNFCVHKYFYDRSPIWQQVAEEEKQAVSEEQTQEKESFSDDEIDQDETKPFEPVHFEPIDSRHLSSMLLLKSRLTKLLKSCPHNMHTSSNIMIKIGFVNPTRTDRRFFRSRLRELMEHGVIEKVQVPHADRKRFPDRKVQCIRLVTGDVEPQSHGEVVVDDDFEELEAADAKDCTGLKMNISLHKQMIDLLEDAGSSGMTLNEMSAALGNFDRRTVDLLLNRLEKDPPPAHLADLGIAQLAETHGRERRYKYYTVAHYRGVAEKEGFEDRGYRDVDLSSVGGFLPVVASQFYEEEAELVNHVSALTLLKREGPSTSKKKRVNPILPDGSVKKGRPRKSVLPDSTPAASTKGKKRKREDPADGGEVQGGVAADGTNEPPPKKKRGRPPKKVGPPATPADAEGSTGNIEATSATPSVNKRRRGRPPKQTPVANHQEGESASVAAGPSSQTSAIQRGRRPPEKSLAPTEEDVFGPASLPEKPASSTDAMGPALPLKGLSGIDIVAPSSPLSSIPSSPLRESSPTPAAAPLTLGVKTFGETILTARRAAGDAAAESAGPSLRRSTRTPKVRKRGDSLSPSRSARRQRQGRTSEHTSLPDPDPAGPLRQADAVSSIPTLPIPDPSATIQPAHIDGHTSVPPPAPDVTSDQSRVPADIPIDPVLQAESLALLATHRNSLIAMTPEPETLEASSSISQGPSKKRSPPDIPSTQSRAKRTKSAQSEGSNFRTKSNISQSRRENEMMRLLAEANGMMNTSCKEFYEAHAALVDTITKAGEVASTRPGAKIDKRTLESTLLGLESKGKVKMVTTMVPNPTGSTRPVRVVYLPETPAETLTAFLSALGETVQPIYAPSLKTIEEPLEYGGGRPKPQPKSRPLAALQPDAPAGQLEANATDLFSGDDQTIRDALLTEKNTVAQLYGYIVGKAARARALHMLTVDVLEKGSTSPQIVSPGRRIINLAYYYTDTSISTYCRLVAVLEPIEELGKLLQSVEGQVTPVNALSESLRNILCPTQSKTRARILSLLDVLRVLGLVIPLVPTDSPNPAITCDSLAGHPTAFDIGPPGPYTPSTAPVYWRFNDIAPIRLWSLSNGLPPVWKMETIATSEQTAAFWADLEKVSLNPEYAESILGTVPPLVEDAPEDVVQVTKTLRRSISWNAIYSLSWYQTEYLHRYIDPATGHTPLEDEEEGETQLNRLSWVVSAHRDVLVNYFAKARKKHLRDLKRVEARVAKGKQKAQADEDAGAVLTRRAAEAREQRARDWENMVQRIHPGELRSSAMQRIQRIKTKFMQGAGKPSEKWESKITEAIREADMVAAKLLPSGQSSNLSSMPIVKPVLPAPVVTATQEKDVDELIAAQGPRAQREARTKKSKKGKDKDTGESASQTPRRHRFLWNRDYDELVRDASAIIKARCRNGTRLDWGALEQVFPAVPRNSVRQRLVHLKEAPGTETYLARLEEKWHDLWAQHRGTDLLPDPDPESASNFDLAAHVKFLRKHIDKNAIRVGFVEVQDSQKTVLPASIEALEREYDVIEKVPSAPAWDFMWSVVAEEGREKQFAQQAFTVEVGDMPPTGSYESEFTQVADAAVKITLGNPNETYEPDVASQLLKELGEEPVRIATTELLSRGVLAKTVRDPAKSKPGRTLKISDSNLNALGGQLHHEVFQDASALEELILQQEDPNQWQKWSLLATDGDAAFLIELASENRVRFDVDTSHSRSMRTAIDWNSKKADDDDIETDIRVRYLIINCTLPAPEPEPEPPELPAESSGTVEDAQMQVAITAAAEHGSRVDGEPAFCRRRSEGLVDCRACLDEAETLFLQELDQEERTVAEKVLAVLRNAGSAGLSKQQVVARLEALPQPTAEAIVQRMADAAIPLAYWTGYSAVALVSATRIRPWAITVPDPENADVRSMVFPRRWLDIYGRKLREVWDTALRAVMGLILLRPGISQAEIRWRLRSVYDRQEVGELLQTLQDEGCITPRVDVVGRRLEIGPADDREERFTFWFLASGSAGRRWFQL
ncbi:hypothetical protein C8Q79DRAFT_933943 [Trametes meyenii]|nr:hypothetical protein C8Q79DRAFT_933943 [Trametes meyenii]